MAKSTKMNNEVAARIYSATAKAGNGNISKGSFAARAKSSADTNTLKAPAPATGKMK